MSTSHSGVPLVRQGRAFWSRRGVFAVWAPFPERVLRISWRRFDGALRSFL